MAIPGPGDFTQLKHWAAYRGRIALRAPLTTPTTLESLLADENPTAEVDTILAYEWHVGKLYVVAHRAGSINKTYLYRLDVTGETEGGGDNLPIATIWTGANIPRVKITSFEGGSATAGVQRVYFSDQTENYVTRFWDSDGLSIADVKEDFDDDNTKESLSYPILFEYQDHLFGTDFRESGVLIPGLLRFSQPGLIPADEPGVTNNVSREWWNSDFRLVGSRGTKVVSVSDAGGRKMLFKRTLAYSLQGFDSSSWVLTDVSTRVGAVGLHASAALPDGTCLFWSDRGPMLTDGTQNSVRDIGADIRRRIDEITFHDDLSVEYSPDEGLCYVVVSNDTGIPEQRLAWDVGTQRWVNEGTWAVDGSGTALRVKSMRAIPDDILPGPAGAPGAPVRVAFDDFVDTADSDLDLHVPNLNIDGWEYGDATGEWFIKSSDRAQRQSGGGEFVRSTTDMTAIDLQIAPFTVEIDVARGAVDDTGSTGFLGFFQRSSGVGDPYDGEGIWVGFIRTSASEVSVVARRINPGGGIAETLNFAVGFAMANATSKRFTFAVSADGVTIDCTASDFQTGLNPVELTQVVLTSDIRSSDHQRIGLSAGAVGSGATDIYKYDLLALSGGAGGVVVTTVSDTELDVAWVNGDVTTGVETDLHRGTSTGFAIGAGNLIATLGSGIAAFSDSGLATQTAFFYKLVHRRNGQTSAESPEGTAKTANATPTGLTATSLVNGNRVKVTVVEGSTDLVIERRKLSLSGIGGFAWSTLTTLLAQTPGLKTHDDTTAVCGTKYAYRAKSALVSETDSPYSNEGESTACSVTPDLTAVTHVVTLDANDCPALPNIEVRWAGTGFKPTDTAKIYQNDAGGGFVLVAEVLLQTLIYLGDTWLYTSGGTGRTLEYRVEAYDGGTLLVDTEDSTQSNESVDEDACPPLAE